MTTRGQIILSKEDDRVWISKPNGIAGKYLNYYLFSGEFEIYNNSELLLEKMQGKNIYHCIFENFNNNESYVISNNSVYIRG